MLVSVDFNYFIRERMIWDFSHSESNPVFNELVWGFRSQSIDLIKETSVEEFADFYPMLIKEKLKECGINILDNTNVGMADSHRHAYDFFLESCSDTIISFDAYLDIGYKDDNDINCGNWLTHLNEFNNYKNVIIVIPKWSILEGWYDEDDFYVNVNDMTDSFNNLKIITIDKLEKLLRDIGEFDKEIERFFICRSSVWVPPHHDDVFLKVIKIVSPLHYHALEKRTFKYR